jgi:hypothetical protein
MKTVQLQIKDEVTLQIDREIINTNMMRNPLTTLIFIEEAKKIHNENYSYNHVHYLSNKIKIIITCPKHGNFEQTPNNHLNGRGCPTCKKFKMILSKEEFFQKAKEIHGNKYNYDNVLYVSSKKPIIIDCPIHGKFSQRAGSHLSGRGCKLCRITILTSNKEKFVKHANSTHNFKYDYEQTYYVKAIEKVNIKCPLHGIFVQRPSEHLTGHGCPICSESSGEKLIRNYLENNQITFQTQFRILECRNIRPLPFDFAICKNECMIGLIEFHGKQHYSACSFGSKTISGEKLLSTIQKCDKIKQNYCKQHQISLLIIPYWKRKDIAFLINSFKGTLCL